MRTLLLIILSVVTADVCLCDDAGWNSWTTVETRQTPRVLVDPKTKVSYYLESDRRHIAAISADGRLLWCCAVATVSPDRNKICPNWGIVDFKLEKNPGTGKEMIDVTISESGYGGGWIDLKSGRYMDSGSVL